MAGVAVQVAEGGDRPIGARVAEPARGPHRGRAGVGGIGDRQLGGGEDRLAGAPAELVGGLGEAGVLALVVGDDALEAVGRGKKRPSRIIRAWFDWMPRPR